MDQLAGGAGQPRLPGSTRAGMEQRHAALRHERGQFELARRGLQRRRPGGRAVSLWGLPLC